MSDKKSAVKQYLKSLLQATLLPLCYRSACGKPIDRRLMIFADSNTDDLPESMQSLWDEFTARGYKCERQCRDVSRAGIVGTLKFMCGFMRRYAVARGVVICNYFLPVNACKKRRGTRVVQLWHSCGAFKKFGYSTPNDISSHFKGSVSRNIDLVTVSSPACISAFEEAFRLEKGVARAVGVCRTDVFFDKNYEADCRRELYEKHPELRGKKLILYLPTFRGDASRGYTVGKDETAALREPLGEKFFVAMRMHPRAGGESDLAEIPTNRLLPCADMLITDYSSVVFEYALLKRPMLLWCPDLEEYTSSRDFYLDIKREIPAPIITDGEKLYGAVLEELARTDFSQFDEFNKKYTSSCDGGATKRVADMFEPKKQTLRTFRFLRKEI